MQLRITAFVLARVVHANGAGVAAYVPSPVVVEWPVSSNCIAVLAGERSACGHWVGSPGAR
jgi:hypothetical protein